MPFTSDPIIKLDRTDPRFWTVQEPLTYTGSQGDTWTVPVGFRTDLASVPRGFLWLVDHGGRHTAAAILHDYLCEKNRTEHQPLHIDADLLRAAFPTLVMPEESRGSEWISRRDADGVFRRVLGELGVPDDTRWAMWAAVRFGSHWSDATTKEKAQGYGLLAAAVCSPVLLAEAGIYGTYAALKLARRLGA